MNTLKFVKGKVIQKKKPVKYSDDRGYYFKGEFLSLYKTESINILRKRIIKAGKGDWDLGKKKLPDEAKLIMFEYNKQKKISKLIEEKKKPYFEKIKKESILNKIEKLKNEIEELERRKDL